jgi:hypothetical protein
MFILLPWHSVRRYLSSIEYSRYFQVEKGATNKGYDEEVL